MSKQYRINEVFYSLQGEGVRAGTANIFVRFSGCNMRCSQEAGEKSPGGFDCDTEFESGRSVSLQGLMDWIFHAFEQGGGVITKDGAIHSWDYGKTENKWLILTGGEPALQVDREFCDYFHKKEFKLAIETNGSIEVPQKTLLPRNPDEKMTVADALYLYDIDWITVSPKVAEHCIRQKFAHEVKYVRAYGQAIPKTVVEAEHYLISPAFDGNQVHPETMAWCQKLVMENPKWRLSVQQHKGWKVR